MTIKHFKIELKKSLDVLGNVGFLESWEFRNDLVAVKRGY